MSIFRNTREKNTGLNRFVSAVKRDLESRGAEVSTESLVQSLVSTESLSDANHSALTASFESARSMVRDIALSIGMENLDPETAGEAEDEEALDAAATAAVASSNPAEYANVALNSEPQGGANVTVIEPTLSGANGEISTTDAPAMEAYDDRNLREAAQYSVAFNFQAPRQSEFGEAFFPTVTVAPELGGIDVEIQTQNVFNGFRHPHTGKHIESKKINLIQAFVNHEVLADNSTDVVPHVASDGSNAGMFVDSSFVAPVAVNVGGVAVNTAPLKTGEYMSLLGLSSHPALLGTGILNETDNLDGRLVLKALYIKTSDGKALKFNTAGLSRSQFQKSAEGNQNEMTLTFTTRSLFVDSNTKAVDGSTTADFAQLPAGAVMRLSLNAQGMADVETSNIQVTGNTLRVVSIVQADGTQLDLETGAGKTLADAVRAMTVEGYDVQARRSNSNHRTRGRLLDTTVQVERYRIPLCSPITVQRPMSSARDASDLKGLIDAARAINSNDAVTTLLNYADSLAQYVRGPRFNDFVPEVLGAGRHFVTPFFERHTLDLIKALNVVKSHEKAADVSAALVNPIRDVAARMVRDSNYMAALECLSGGSKTEFELVVGTDSVIAQQLMVSGDTRTFGDLIKNFVIVSTPDRRMRNKIVLTLRRKGAAAPDPLSFGVMAWIPELTTTIEAAHRDGGISREVTVTPRKLHLPLLPVMAMIDVQNLSAVLANKIDQAAVAQTVPANTWTDNVIYP